MNRHIIETAAVFLLISGSVLVESWAMDIPPGTGKHMGPPPEAIEACRDKNKGDTVEITSPRGEKMNAVCEQIDGQLIAVPEGGFRGQKVLPPGERHSVE